MVRYLTMFLMLATGSLLTGCDLIAPKTEQYLLRGQVMGTTYMVKALDARGKVDKERLYNDIKSSLDEATNIFSNWEKESELSRFNASPSTRWQDISDPFSEVMVEAMRIHHLSDGRFDVTLAPLIDLWGFGPNDDERLPGDLEVNEALKQVGQDELLEFRSQNGMQSASLRKRKGTVTINLSAIAKGYGADLIARKLESHGIENFLIEIGGDLLARGMNERGESWRVGIEKPNIEGGSVQLVVSVKDMGMATSGDYRNFVMKGGKRLSHILDPRTGRPVDHNLTSVTVLADSGMRADGLATALLVLGEKEGLAVAERENIAAYFITRNEDGYQTSSSGAFDRLMAQK
ncbi:FAD:protein FMN transferase [Cohaesibacter gelatinilyticus]|uniref:FAD:protein FMN transferase n=1 Tax=Cohaesibacter gelatinilyticus TaxID=372072 RepID=A0A285NAN8_9HYPH|nr:FAD:protein FMN transferase [Cohaesibacter gelatinilyticus]SNZ06500.1 thiamine biosynthesis lipoprotein [Cohaesibacter gelatinilyticus]